MDTARRLVAAFALLFAFSNSSNVVAQASQVQVTPVASSPYSTTTFNTVRNTTFEARNSANGGLYYQRAVTFSQSQVAAAARTRIGVLQGAAAALSAAMLAVGYTMDELSSQIYSDEGQSGVPVQSGITYSIDDSYCFSSTVSGTLNCWKTLQYAYGGYSAAEWSVFRSDSYFTNGAGKVTQYAYDQFNPVCQCWTDKTLNVAVTGQPDPMPAWAPGDELATAPAPATDQQIFDVLRTNPAAMEEAFHNSLNTPRVLEPMPAVMNDVAAQYRLDTNQPLAEGQTDPVNTAESANTAPSSAAMTFPLFCSWASTVCAAIDWMKADPPTSTDADVVIDEAPVVQQTFVSGLGAGTCPASVSITVSLLGQDAPIDFSYQPMCDFATLIYPLTVVMSLLMAAYILSGVKMNV